MTSESSQEQCTDVVSLPIADTVAGAGFGTLGYLERHSGSKSIALILDVTAIPFLISAVYGYVGTERCHRYDKLFDRPPQTPQPTTNAPPAPPHTP